MTKRVIHTIGGTRIMTQPEYHWTYCIGPTQNSTGCSCSTLWPLLEDAKS